MTSVASRLPAEKIAISEWLPVIIGLLALYVPTLYSLFTDMWASEEQAHGPMILALSLWLLHRQWPLMMEKSADKPPSKIATALGWGMFVFGLLCYIIGRSVIINPLEMGSFIFLMVAILLIKRGSAGLKVLWFPLFFMLFMIPLPGPLVSMLTLPMKMAVSYVTENILFMFGYPIARSGVILQIGQYQLLVADACAGLQTLLTLEALGMFYLNLVRHTSVFRNATLAILIVPISFTANVIRVMVLTLITYYFGDAAGQGFLHGFAGMVLFISALSLILGMDTLLQFIIKVRSEKATRHGSEQP
ncbi:MAG: exosortase B [Burkholderiaceae bacterium]